MSDFQCPICLRDVDIEPKNKGKQPKWFQLHGKGTEHAICDSCADIVEMLRGGSVEDSEILIVRLSVFHRALLARFAPFWGKTDAEVIKALAMRWIEANVGVPNIMLLCQMNERVKEEIGVKEDCKIKQETPDDPTASPPTVLAEKGDAPGGAALLNGFAFRDCTSEPFAYDSLTPVMHEKTKYYLDANGMMRIERGGYPCATHAYLADILYLYEHPNDVKKLLKHIDHNRRPIITGFLKDVPLASLHPIKPEIKKDCPEKDCINKSPEQCPFCTNKSRYENAKMKKRKELRVLAAKMGVK